MVLSASKKNNKWSVKKIENSSCTIHRAGPSGLLLVVNFTIKAGIDNVIIERAAEIIFLAVSWRVLLEQRYDGSTSRAGVGERMGQWSPNTYWRELAF